MKKLIAAILLVGLCGCTATQLRQEFVGYSVNDVKNSNAKQVQDFDMSTSDCVAKIKVVLKDMGATVREDKGRQYMRVDNFNRVFRSAINTTQVGILVTSVSENRCRVEIASGNVDLAVFVAKEIAIKDGPKKEAVLTK